MLNAQELRRFLIDLTRPSKQFVMISVDIMAYMTCAFATAWVLTGVNFPVSSAFMIGLVSVAVAIPLGWSQGLYQSIVRYIGSGFFFAASVTAACTAIIVSLLTFVAAMQGTPFRWALVFATLSLAYLCGSRYLSRSLLAPRRPPISRQRVIVYGAGSAGVQLVASLQSSGDVIPVAMVDDDPALQGRVVKGLRVYPPADIEKIVTDRNVTTILLAIPSASLRRRQLVLEKLSLLSARVHTIPDFRDLVSGQARVDDLREVVVADLLGRQPVPPDPKLLTACIQDKTVMVTGAGGSIGSELCRQIVHLGATRLLLFDIAEVALYSIDKELRVMIQKEQLQCELLPLLGSVEDYERVADVLDVFRVQTIYHAAAYKHVPIVEQNVFEGIQNNAFGTFELARAAVENEVETFVLISTDKAVRPTNIMGTTKRVAELILQALQQECSDTRFCMVRFGNVLESSGSVVPLFREQIRAGGPVTVTHPDIVRYFMTIPEAAELVLQAGSMAEGGDVFVLDMGKPMRIQELARRMISLTGRTIKDDDNPEGDIEIVYTGLRPAEKLYEELLVGDDVSGTEHPRIMRAVDTYIPYSDLCLLLEQLKISLSKRDCDRAREILLKAVSSYQPTNIIDDLVWMAKEETTPKSLPANISSLREKRPGDDPETWKVLK
jgi:FlaA1/EpsC-like NDP-sugar epimerase